MKTSNCNEIGVVFFLLQRIYCKSITAMIYFLNKINKGDGSNILRIFMFLEKKN